MSPFEADHFRMRRCKNTHLTPVPNFADRTQIWTILKKSELHIYLIYGDDHADYFN